MPFTVVDPERLRIVKDFDLSPLHDEQGNGLNSTLLVRSWVALLLSTPLERPIDDKLLIKQLTRFRNHFRKTVIALSDLADEFFDSVVEDDFGQHVVSLHMKFARTFIFREYCAWFESGDSTLFKFISSFLTFGKKAEYIDASFNARSFQAWCENEYRIGKIVYPPHILEDLRRIIASSGLKIQPEDVATSHGPGTVSEEKVKRLSQKCENARYSPQLQSYYENNFPGFDSYSHSGDSSDGGPTTLLTNVKLWKKGRIDPKFASREYAGMLFVPDSIKKARTITRQPVSYMQAQQGVMRALEKAIDKTVYKDIIHLRDQSFNQRSAMLGASGYGYDTTDLSRASDSVTTRLIMRIFPEHLLVHLIGTRVDLVKLPSGHIVRCEGFAGMGSSTCFPLQCCIFATFAMLAAYLRYMGIHISDYLAAGLPIFQGEPWVEEGMCVFGDDIVTRSNQTESLMSLLAAMGFVVNSDKSFYGSRVFRESCGHFYMRGRRGVVTNVTPIRFKVRGLTQGKITIAQSLIDLVNRAFEYGYFYLRQLVLDYIPRWRYVETTEDSPHKNGPCHVVWFSSANEGVKSRWSYWDGIGKPKPSLHRREYVAWVPHTIVTKVSSDPVEIYRYNRQLQVPSNSTGKKPPTGDTDKTVLRRVWTAA